MGGAQPLAVTMNGGRVPDHRRRPGPAAPPGRAPATSTSRRRDRRSDDAAASWPCWRAKASGARAVGRAGRQLRRPCCRSCCAAASQIDIVTDQTSAHDPLSYLPDRASTFEDWHDYAAAKPEEFTDRARASMARHVRGDGRLPGRRRRGLRLRQLDPRRGPAGRLRPGVRLPRLRARLHPAAVLRGQGPVPLGGAVRRPARHRAPPTARCWTCSRTTTTCTGGCALAQRAGRLPGPAGADLLARLRRARPRRAAVQRDGRLRRAVARRS